MKFRNKELKAIVYPFSIFFFLVSLFFSNASHATEYHGYDYKWTEEHSLNSTVWYVCMHRVVWYTWEGCLEKYSHETTGQLYPVSCSSMGAIEGVWLCWSGNCTPACNCIAEVCDGKDNNCNGQIDEGFNVGAACSIGIGACKRDGQLVCSQDKTGTVCSATPGEPTPEICHGKDNNCNGLIDEGAGCEKLPGNLGMVDDICPASGQ